MAKNLTFNKGNLNISNITEYPNSFKRQGAFPLERFSVFNTIAALKDYAANNPIAYVGQQLVLIDESTHKATVYVIQATSGDNMLAKLGDADAIDSDLSAYAKIAADNTFSGSNTFSKPVSVATPTADDHATTKKYVDDKAKAVDDKLVNYAKLDASNTYTAGKNDFTKVEVSVAAPTVDDHAATKKYVDDKAKAVSDKVDGIDDKITGLGTVMNLADVITSEKFLGFAGKVPATWTDGSAPKAGDVILVKTDKTGDNDNDKEYVVVSDGSTLKFELLGDPSGLTALTERVNTIEGKLPELENEVTSVTSADDQLTIDPTTGDVVITVNKVDNALHADSADKVDDALNIFTDRNSTWTFDGSAVKTIKTTDMIAKADTKDADGKITVSGLGLVKPSTGVVDGISVAADGTMTVDASGVSKAAKATEANHVEKSLKIGDGSKTYNGSAEETITLTDLGFDGTLYATSEQGGKANTALQPEDVDIKTGTTNGTISVKIGSSDTATDVAVKGLGSAAYTESTDYATAEQGGKANSAVQGVTIAGKTASIDNDTKVASISATDLKTGLGLGSAAYTESTDYATAEQGGKANTALQPADVVIGTGTADGTISVKIGADGTATNVEVKSINTAAYKKAEYFATDTALTRLDEAAAKIATDNTFSGSNTFSKPVSVATPTADDHAATKKYVDENISTKIAAVDSMRFCGLLGGTGNITKLPSENVKNGDTYKVSVAGTYDGQTAKAGDMFIALVTTGTSGATIAWQYIPSADDGNVSAAATLTTDQVIVGNGNKDVKTLAAGEDGKVLKMVGGKPAWADESLTDVTSTGGTLTRTKSGTVVNLEVAKVNVDKLEQTENTYIILNCGSSTVNI